MKTKEVVADYTCWSCRKEVQPEEAKRDTLSSTYMCCPHCGAKFIRGVGRWVRPYSTLSPEEALGSISKNTNATANDGK